jgi:hypothetical protein
MKQPSSQLKDLDIVQIHNSTFLLNVASSPKKLNYFSNTKRTVYYYDSHSNYEKPLSIPTIEEVRTELLAVRLASDQVLILVTLGAVHRPFERL